MLAPGNLLDLIRTFTLFSVNDKGETIKIVGRFQQFRAVKRAVKRLLEGRSPRTRSGIVWHTQGSGKSLTMKSIEINLGRGVSVVVGSISYDGPTRTRSRSPPDHPRW